MQTATPAPTAAPVRDGRRLARDIERALHIISRHEPGEDLAPAEAALLNHLLLRGGRFFARVRTYQRARPFPPARPVPARAAVLALFRLLVRIDPRVLRALSP